MDPSEVGVRYTLGAETNTILYQNLRLRTNPRVSFVRITWTDFANVVRFRVVPLAYFEKLAESARPGITIAKAGLGILDCKVAEGIPLAVEYVYRLDLTSIRMCPYEPGHAMVMGFFEDKDPVRSPTGELVFKPALCARSVLKRVVENAHAEKTAFLVGFESEFVLLKNTSPIEPIGIHEYSASNSLRSGRTGTVVMDEIARAVKAAGIELQMYHAEAAPGQYEVVTGPLPPLEAADALVLTREIIHNVAAKHGVSATFAPRVFADRIGTAAHAHISVHSTDGGDKKIANQLSGTEQGFLAGLMTHLPSITALTLPTIASYARVADGVWSGGTYVCWGTENRECPVRLTNMGSASSRRFEMRFLDGTANPYLALAGIFGAGVAGLRSKQELKVKDCGREVAAEMSEQDRAALGITDRMPRTWEEARTNFNDSQEMGTIFGDELKTAYLSIGKLVKEYLEEGTDDDRKRRLVELY